MEGEVKAVEGAVVEAVVEVEVVEGEVKAVEGGGGGGGGGPWSSTKRTKARVSPP